MSKENALQKSQREHNSNFSNAPLKRKISFFSSIFIVIGSVMGAGIFFKSQAVLNNSQGSVLFSVFAWLLAVGAIMLMAMALIEITSARNDNLSIIGWCQTFNSRYVYKACKNFMVYLYIPLTFFYLPLYFIQSIQNGIMAFTQNANITQSWGWVVIMIGCIAITTYFIFACGLSSRIGNIQNWIITVINFIPVVITVIFGIYGAANIGGLAGGQAGVNSGLIGKPIFDYVGFIPSGTANANQTYQFASMTPGFGLFIGLGAIFFAYDGFYIGAGIQSEMKEPKKISLSLVLGLSIVTLVYLVVAISMSFSSTTGSPDGMRWIFERINAPWLYGVFQLLIGIGVLSIINGFGMWSPRFIENLMRDNQLPFSAKFINKLNDHRPIVGVIYSLVLSLIIIISFCIIGALGYLDTINKGTTFGSIEIAKLYSFSDLMGTWSSVGVFLFILCPIIGALKNRKTRIVHVKENKFLYPCAIGAITVLAPAILITFFAPIADLFLLYRIPEYINGVLVDYGVNYTTSILIPRLMTVVVLIITICATLLPNIIEDFYLTYKFGSVHNGEVYKIKRMAEAVNKTPKEIVLAHLKSTLRYELTNVDQEILGQKFNKDDFDKLFAKKH